MQVPTAKLKQLLVEPGHIAAEDFKRAQEQAKKDKIPLQKFLVSTGLISDEHLSRTIADAFDYHFVDLKKIKIPADLLEIIPEAVVRAQRTVAFEKQGNILKAATTDPQNYEFFKLLEKKTGFELEIYYTSDLSLEEALKYYKAGLSSQVIKLIQELARNPQDESSVVKLVNLFLEYARDSRASDIHLEPLKKKVDVRFRIDGILHQIADYPKELHDQIVFRLKIMSRLRTDEHSAAQDGRFSFEAKTLEGQEKFDVRVSILPITEGENVVMRLLAEYSSRLSLSELGLSDNDLVKLEKAAKKPHGMILVTGPTGCGKTTTLYAVLQILNKPDVNIMTIEDPVEYDVEHIQQTQVNPKKNLTFATGLRSIVRQDPDIIMVGEIRDNETAGIAVNAAMTGHLVLSTLHTNDASTTFPRLIEMSIEPFLVASSVNVVVAQRLVRKTCERCRQSCALTKEELALIKGDPGLLASFQKVSGKKDISQLRFFKGRGCPVCSQTGYSGRTGIFEVLELGEEIRRLISQKETADVIDQKARKLGMTSMLEDGLGKILKGMTTLEEVLRASKI